MSGDYLGIYQLFHENKLALCAAGITTGIPLTLISILSLMFEEGDTGIIKFSNDLFGNWAFWIILPGLFMLIVGTYYIFAFFKNLREFKSLIDIERKATFIKRLDRIEELAWRLHPKYERIVIEKKKKYKIK